jgi:hypothetical protein
LHNATNSLNCFSSFLVRLGHLVEQFVEQDLSFSIRAKSSGLISIFYTKPNERKTMASGPYIPTTETPAVTPKVPSKWPMSGAPLPPGTPVPPPVHTGDIQ